MLETFNKLVKRTVDERTFVKGDPMDVIPIKNAKYARECIEVHLAHRNIEILVNFDKFPNLECLWLNDNQARNSFPRTQLIPPID